MSTWWKDRTRGFDLTPAELCARTMRLAYGPRSRVPTKLAAESETGELKDTLGRVAKWADVLELLRAAENEP